MNDYVNEYGREFICSSAQLQSNRLLSLLGICRKAGKLVYGFDAVSEAARGHTAELILTASDLSPKSKKEIEFISAKEGAPAISAPVTMSEIEWKTGRRAGILAVADKGLAEAVKRELEHSLLSRVNEED